MGLPAVPVETKRALDRRLVEHHGIDVPRLVQLAGDRIAAYVRDHVDGDTVHVVAGPGHNGGDGLVAARLLHAWGYAVTVTTVGEPASVTAQERRIVDSLDLTPGDMDGVDIVVDALLGYGADGPPRPPIDAAVDAVNDGDTAVVSVDVPTGVDPDTGTVNDPCVAADATVVLAVPTTGLTDSECSDVVGELWVADIGVPPAAYAAVGAERPTFQGGPLQRIRP